MRVDRMPVASFRGEHQAMRTSFHLFGFSLMTAVLLLNTSLLLAQDSALVRHFDYDQKAPLRVKQIGVLRRERATIYDITFYSPNVGGVLAYLVVPTGRGPVAALMI